MKHTQPRALRASAVSLAIAGMLMAGSAYAGKIDNLNNTTGKLGACGVDGETTACVGAWDLGNVEVSLLRALDGTVFGEFLEATGFYTALAAGDSFVSAVTDAAGDVVAKVSGKVWPVGEPTGIKAVNDDTAVKEGKPQNCLINTAYLSEFDTTNGVSGFLDMPAPLPVICSSPFQTHKRFKIAMQPATVQLVDPKPIDLVFNVSDENADPATLNLRPYQVFSKINNYTGKQLKGYKIVVGTGTGTNFVSASEGNITGKLQISLGINEVLTDDNDPLTPTNPVPGNIFDGDGLATFSHGLFGAPDKHFTEYGFFDGRTAGFEVAQSCANGLACLTGTHPVTGATIDLSDTIFSGAVLESNYAGPTVTPPLTAPLFGDWLPAEWAPKGIFFDDDNDPTTDAVLQAYWNGTAWIKGYDNTDPALSFVPVSATEFATWKANAQYSIDTIEDVLNLGINYIVKVGDDLDNDPLTDSSQITIRILPVVADTQVAPSYVGTTPTPLVDPVAPVDPAVPTDPVAPVTTTDDGGGCSASTSQHPVDPVLPLLAALGLAGWGLRRARRS